MRARPGRLLPSVIVGGLLISGLALGAGTASAAQILKDGAVCTIKTKPTDADAEQDKTSGYWIGKVDGDLCKQTVTVPATVVSAAADAVTGTVGAVTGGDSTTEPAPTTKTVTLGAVSSSSEEQKAQADKAASDKAAAKAAADKAAADKAAADRLAAQQGRAVVPPPALGAPAPLAAAGPVGALPALPPLAGVAPAGLASSLFGANAYDPGLLMGSPLGNAASALFSPQADSAVTTVSQAQALAATGTSGYGTPVTIGVIILACLIGFAVRHRVISRMKSRELPAAEYQPRHAAPEPTPEQEPETDLHPAADDAKTLVVLTRR
ncbi:hypothetical protein [Actinomycetospora sp. CA-084318]|uniref:hypothetical protein n=1 Tax=Actinomycetospora sp. CA-084318 TaxID=3239892 RepID=UPI003D97BC77